jgi:hypothetical protein
MPKSRQKIRRVKSSKNIYKKKKSGLRKLIETVALVAVVSVLVFVGFTIAKTVLNYQPNVDPPADTPAPPDGTSDDSRFDEPDPSETDSPDSPSEQSDSPNAVYAPPNVLESAAALSAYLAKAKSENYGAVVVEMKDDEGKLLYKSGIKVVLESPDFPSGNLTAKQIADACVSAGLKPIARINTLKDHVAPGKIADISYEGWLDDKPGIGKLWANPFLQGTVTYISEITKELNEAGFSRIILAGNIFPDFRGIDFQILPSQVTSPDIRFPALINLVNTVADNNPEAVLCLEMSASDFASSAPSGTAEILRNDSNSLKATEIIMAFSQSDFPSLSSSATSSPPTNDGGVKAKIEKTVQDSLKKAAVHSKKLEIIPLLNRAGLSQSDFESITAAFDANGHENYFIKN